MRNPPLSQIQIEERLGGENLDEWLRLWWVSQGGEPRNRRLRLIAEMLPFYFLTIPFSRMFARSR